MALTQRSIGKSRHRMILLVLTAITLLSLDLSSFGPLGTAQRLVRDLLHPITEVAGAIVSPFSDAWNAVFDYDDLEAQNRLLTERIQQLEGNELAVEAERAGFDRLRAGDRRRRSPRPRPGDGDRGSRWGRKLRRRRHHDRQREQDGVRNGMAVITNAGLVGRVERADATTSAVLLLTDTDLIVGVRLADTDEVGLGHVDPDDPSIFIVDTGLEWPEDGNESLLPALDTVVVTAATSRYPSEIPLGRIVEVLPGDEDMLTMHVRAALANDITDLGFVSVLLAEGVDQVPLDEPVPSTSIPLTTTTSAGRAREHPGSAGHRLRRGARHPTDGVRRRADLRRRTGALPSSPWSRRSSWAPNGARSSPLSLACCGTSTCRLPSVSRRSSSPWLRLSSPRSMRDCSTTLGPSLSAWSPSAVPPA